MKSYKHLWEDLISDDNIRLAIINAARGNMKRAKLTYLRNNIDSSIPRVREWIINYYTEKHTPKTINDGISAKKREIIVPTVREHVVQHAIMNVLKPIFMKGMYEHSYASTPGRGCHKGMRVVKKWTQQNSRYVKYCLKLDIRKYFESIPQETLISRLHNLIHDEKFADLLDKVIRTTDKGLPLGFYSSQWLANWYLQGLDHYIKEVLHIKYYIRYMDDMVIFHSNKKELHQIHQKIEEYLGNIGLEIKQNWQLFRFHTKWDTGRLLDFMGFRFYRNRVTLRRKIALKAMRKARRIAKKKRATVHDARQMITYIGWTKCTNTYNWLHKHILAFVSFKKMRRIVSAYDRTRRMMILAKNGWQLT